MGLPPISIPLLLHTNHRWSMDMTLGVLTYHLVHQDRCYCYACKESWISLSCRRPYWMYRDWLTSSISAERMLLDAWMSWGLHLLTVCPIYIPTFKYQPFIYILLVVSTIYVLEHKLCYLRLDLPISRLELGITSADCLSYLYTYF